MVGMHCRPTIVTGHITGRLRARQSRVQREQQHLCLQCYDRVAVAMKTSSDIVLKRRDRFTEVSPLGTQDSSASYVEDLSLRLDTLRVAARVVDSLEAAKAATQQDEGNALPSATVIVAARTHGAKESFAEVGGTAELSTSAANQSSTSGITVEPRKASLLQKLRYRTGKGKLRPENAVPRYWNLLGKHPYNALPAVGDVYYPVSQSFDRPFDGEALWDRGALECFATRSIKGFYVQCTVDTDGVTGHNKVANVVFTSKRAGAEVYAFFGLERLDIKSSVVNSGVPSRLRPHNPKRLPVGIVDCVITADKGFYFKSTKAGQKVDLSVVVPADTVLPRATKWNTELTDYKEPLLEALAANAAGMHSRSLHMQMISRPGTVIAFGVRQLDWMKNTKLEWLAKVLKPLDVVGATESVLNQERGVYKDWKPPERRLSEFLYR